MLQSPYAPPRLWDVSLTWIKKEVPWVVSMVYCVKRFEHKTPKWFYLVMLGANWKYGLEYCVSITWRCIHIFRRGLWKGSLFSLVVNCRLSRHERSCHFVFLYLWNKRCSRLTQSHMLDLIWIVINLLFG